MSTYRGLLERSNGRLRPFVLTRSFFVGSQRYTAVWTGDNTADWGHLKASVPMLLSLSVAGISFVGADVGGFFRNPDEELLLRWYQAGAYQPFFRAHAHLDTKRREPWLFSEQTKLIIRAAIRQRYKLLPYWYTTFREHMVTGMPVMRPLWVEFPGDNLIFDEEKQYLIGNALLVRPVTEAGVQTVSVYLPGKESMWYDFDSFKAQPGPGAVHINTPLDKIPVFLRGGCIIPVRGRVRRSSAAAIYDPYTLIVALNFDASFANGSLYYDDGKTFDYEHGKYVLRGFEYKMTPTNNGLLQSRKLDNRQQIDTDVWIEKILIVGVIGWPSSVKLKYEGKDSVLTHTFDEKLRILTIRRPAVSISKDWIIEVIY